VHYAFGKACQPIMLCKVTYNYIKTFGTSFCVGSNFIILSKSN
jgi:hypothetical protein